MPLAYNAADAFLFPSYQENCPLAPLEAAACGLPVVYRDLPEYRRLYKNEYLAAPDTPGFIKIVDQLRADPAYRARARELSTRVVRQFERDEVLAALEKLYAELAE